jgi:hypothetical protein
MAEVADVEETKATGCEADGFFDRQIPLKPEAVEGLMRDGQIAAYGGPYGMGKTPSLVDLSVRQLYGLDWCGRKTLQKPVIHYDFESGEATYLNAVKNICLRLEIPCPRVPESLTIRLYQGDMKGPLTSVLHEAMGQGPKACLELMRKDLQEKPNALFICDPVELFLPVNLLDKKEVLKLVRCFRELLAEFPHAILLNTFNLRKPDPNKGPVTGKILLSDPRRWLVGGHSDLMNRSDVRLGIDQFDDEVRLINGIRRSEEMNPLFIRPVGNSPENLAGFELHKPSEVELVAAFSKSQLEYWRKLPVEFSFDEVAVKVVPKSSLSRLAKRAKELGILETTNGRWRKLV